jgi:hypothetical protein
MAAAALETYTMKTAHGTDVFVALPPARGAAVPPRAAPTCLLLGWFGSSRRSLSKYANVYRAMGYNTVQTTAPPSVVFSLSQAAALPFLLSLFRVLAADPRLLAGGLVIAPFSNGGAVVLPRLADLLGRAPPTSPTSALPPPAAAAAAAHGVPAVTVAELGLHADDLPGIAAIRDHLAAVVFDSSPCYQHPEHAARALVGGLGIDSRPWLSAAVAFVLRLGCRLQELLYGDVRGRFWASVRSARYPCPELYMYSAADELLDEVALDELVTHRKRAKLGDVRVWRVEDSPHVQLFTTHRTTYSAKVRGVNEWGVNAWRERSGLPGWAMPAVDDL